MKRWKARLMAALLVAVAMLFAVSGLTATAQVVINEVIDGYVCQDLDGDRLIDTCSTCFDTDGDGLVDTCYESNDVFDRIGKPIGSNGRPVDFNDPLDFNDPVSFRDRPGGFNEDRVDRNVAKGGGEDPIGSDAGKDGEEPIGSGAGKREE